MLARMTFPDILNIVALATLVFILTASFSRFLRATHYWWLDRDRRREERSRS